METPANAYRSFLGENFLSRGDVVYVSSDVLALSLAFREQGVKLDLNVLIEAIQECIGQEGTLLFPTYNWDFCKGVAFDIKKTPSKTGALTKAALKREDFSRTAHPLYSMAVWGADSELLLSNNCTDAFGEDSIFGYLREKNAKCLVIGIGALAGLTFIHYVEQTVGVPYRYQKNFTADYTDANGNRSSRTYSMFVRDLDMDPRHIDGFAPLAEKMAAEGKILTRDFLEVPHHLVRCEDLFETVKQDILENDSALMYRYNHLG